MASDLQFGWLSPVIGNAGSDHTSIVLYQQDHILPTAVEHFDSLWIADHFYGFDKKTDPFLEGWTTLTWLAAKFPNVLLCHHVLGHGYRPAALTAKMASTLQVLSNNRFILGIGAGWRGDEYTAYGYDFPKPSVRFAQLEDVLKICKLMWTEDDPTYEGKHYSIDGATASPLPDVVPPICMGTSGEQLGIPMAGRHADIWNGFMRPSEDDWLRKREILWSSAEKAGRDPKSIQISLTCERPLPESDADSAKLVEELAHFNDLGVTHYVMDFGHPQSTEPVTRFVEQVMAPLKAR